MTERNLGAWLEDHRTGLETIALDQAGSPNSTILPTLAVAAGQLAVAEAQLSERDEIIVLGQTLGEGGMGIVRLGTQTSLGRAVAVKSLQPSRQGPEGVLKLVQEAWVTGFLEHPNIVPIYDLTRDEEGQPLLVMRRIEGSPWSALLEDDDEVRSRFGVTEPLEWHLRALMQVASALEFSHKQRVLHLDLKPDNVMIGPLGEVYLVDWGLAMSLDDSGRLPSASANTQIIGTPSYVAPEMLTGEGEWLGVHTDVYLLGSTLYAILSGGPPHRGDNLPAVIFSAVEGTRQPLPATVSPELAGVVDRAMQREPKDRYPSAEAFRLALQDYLEHRGALALVARAHETFAELTRLIDEGGHDGVVAASSAARFGYGQALASWPECEPAQDGFDNATAAYAIWSAQRGDLATAAGLRNQLSRPRAEVDAAMGDAQERARAESERRRSLERLGSELDARTGQRTRLIVVGLLLLSWAALPVAAHFVPGFKSYEVAIGHPLVSIVGLIGLIAWARESLLATSVNRRGMATLLMMLVAQFLVTWGGYRHGLTLDVTMSMLFPLWSLTALLFALTVEPRLWPGAIAYAVGGVVATLWPSTWLWASAACNAAVLANLSAVWRPGASVAPGDVARVDGESSDP